MELPIPLMSLDEEQQLFGPYDCHAKASLQRFGVRFASRDGVLRLIGEGDAVALMGERVRMLLAGLRKGKTYNPGEANSLLFDGQSEALHAAATEAISGDCHEPKSVARSESVSTPVGRHPRMPRPRTDNQAQYMQAMQDNSLVLGAGPAGTGKTYLAVAATVSALREGRVKRIVLTRPAVEAGEHLGFLPGDLHDKVDPYLRPLFDALNDLFGPATALRMKELDVVEIAPLAFMRGRTLNQSFVILDEAQNATVSQLKMFLTRLGEGTVAVVTGDHTQSDLPSGRSGLVDAMDRLAGIPKIATVVFHKNDVQRSKLVQRIVEAYEGD